MITVKELSKIYKMYNTPLDRLKEALFPSSKKHVQFHALKNLDFTINKGETIGIIGKNGSGKSTLLKILSGVLTPTSGEVDIKGKVSAILELGAGFNLEYTGLENIYLNGTLHGKSRREIDEKINNILEFADIGDFIHQPVKTYSSGMFARLAFAVAINVDADILIVDEALAVGDMKFQAKCFRKFDELKTNGVTILFVGHDISSIRKFCDQTMWLHQGDLLAFGDTLAVTAEYMEYMNSENEKNINASQKSNNVESMPGNANEEKEKQSLLDPINRWGSQPNLVQSVQVINEKGMVTNTIVHGEVVRVIIRFILPESCDKEEVSVAISFKNKMGLDLLVFTTHDNKELRPNFSEMENEIVFEFVNYFTEGDLIVVAAIEDRSSIQPEYYDYIEGASYLKSITAGQLFGIIHTPVRNYLRK
ncbi:ABC transporter ATP-binding protein [Paenibacillus lautus]|uniref:ABC transporter ATP-binding protein n=1 Tax=Paenibacillus lautus TaxID=1401 RepID=UPI0013C4996E|nr:ABC transporter ATP-binding protein [Paenibacillus lautus]